MKVILLAVLCGLAFARIPKSKSRSYSSSEEKLPYYQHYKNRDVQDKVFHAGKEYKFVYNGQILSGIPGSDRQHSGSRIQALVTVQFQSEQRVVMQLANIRIAKANREIRNPRKTLPFRVFDEVELDQTHMEKLHKPIFFTYTNGLVHDISFEQGEQPWSANIKRGVLNLLQVNLKEHHKLSTEPLSITRNEVASSESNEMPETTDEQFKSQKWRFYRTIEKTMEGECETDYSVSSKPWKHGDPSQQVLNVTKSINFEKCTKRPQIKYNWRFNDYCPTCEPKYQDDEKFLKSSTVVRYNITGTSNKFMIESAEAESQYTFVPMNEESNVINTYVVQRIEIVKTSPIHTQLPSSSQTVPSDSDMIYTVDWDSMKERFFMEGENAFLSKTPYSQIPDKVRIVAELLQKMVAGMTEQVEQQAPQWFSRLVTVLRMANKAEFEQIHQAIYSSKHEHFTPEEHKKVREILVSAVALAGTKDSLSHLIKDIREKRIPEHQQSLALRQLMAVRVVSEQMIHELKTLCQELTHSSAHLSSFYVKQSCWLTYGSFANALCTPNDDQLAIEQKVRPERICPVSLKEQIVKTLFEQLERAERWEDQLVLIKAISNAGIDTSIFKLEKIIKNIGKRYPVFLRVESILAMKNIRDQMPLKIQKILIPIFTNVREHPEIRVTALYEILNTQPDRPVLEMIAKMINTEPSRQVQSFAYTYMSSLANSTQPCFKNMTHNLKLALRYTKEINAGVQYSKLAHLPFHSLTHSLGADLNLANIMSNTSLIPFHSAFTLDANWLGSWQRHLLTLGFSSEGLEPMLYKLIGDEGLLFENTWDDYMERRSHPRNTRMPYQQELRELFQTLKMSARKFEREPKAWFYMKFLNQEYGFLPFSKHLLSQIQPREIMSLLNTGYQVNINKATILHESSFKIPTTIGFPLVYRHKLPAVLAVKGKIHLEMQSERPQLVLDIKPSFAVQSTHSIEVWSPILNSGLKIRAQARAYLPIKAKAVVDVRQMSFKLLVEPPKTPKEVLVLETRPLTFTRVWPKTIQVWKEDEEKTIVGQEHNRVLSYERNYGRKYAGIDMHVRSRIHMTPQYRLKGTPFFPFAGPNKVVVELRPTELTPQEFEIKVEPTSTGRYSEKMSVNMKDFWITKSISSAESSSSSSSSESNSQTVSESSESHEKRRWNKHRPESKSKSYSSEEFDYNKDKWMRSHELKVEVLAKGGRHSDKKLASALFGLKYSEDSRRYGKFWARIEQTPIEQSEKWVACLDVQTMYPKSLLVAESMDRKVVAKAELKWGQSCSSDKYVTLKIQAQPSKKQWELNRLFEDSDCKYYTSKNLKSPVACYEKSLKYGRLNQYLFDLEYRNVPSSMRNTTDKLFRFLKYQYYWQTEVNSVAQNEPNKVYAKVTLDPESYQRINVTIKTPKQTAFLKSIPLPFKVRPLNYRRSMISDIISAMTDNKYSSNGLAVCKVNDRKVRTFDGTKYRVPISTCYSLLAKDCTEEQRFAVLMKKQSSTSQEKKVKILTPQHKIVMFQEGSRIKVQVNDQHYDLERAQPIHEHGHTVVRIYEQEQVVKVELVEAGVQVYFDGYSANIKMSPIYMGRQCGLCGEYDSESTYENEYWTPAGHLSRNVRKFYQDFMVRDQECQAPKSAEICASEECSHSSSSSSESSSSSKSTSASSSSSSSESKSRSRSKSISTSKSGSKSSSQQSSSSSSSESAPNSRETTARKGRRTSRQSSVSSESSEEQIYRKKGKRPPVMQTKVIEEIGRTCFSVEKVPHCPHNTYPATYEATRDVEFQCLSNSDSRVTELLIQVRRGRTVDLGMNARKSFTQKERLPTVCRYV
jgi:very-short-patch-repair endonuclease